MNVYMRSYDSIKNLTLTPLSPAAKRHVVVMVQNPDSDAPDAYALG
jgi:hypothetical protein